MKIPAGLQIDRIEESNVRDEFGNILEFEANLYLVGDTEPIGGGHGSTIDHAKTVALAEAIERFQINRIYDNDPIQKIKFGLDRNSSSSGFAVDPSAQVAAMKALSEGYEHFVRYHGVYRGLHMDTVKSPLFVDARLKTLAEKFDDVQFIQRTEMIQIDETEIQLCCLIAIGLLENGAFLGAKAQIGDLSHSQFHHALHEAWRGERIFKHSKTVQGSSKAHARGRTVFFGDHRAEAMAQINRGGSEWPEPVVDLFACEFQPEVELFLARAMFSGLPNWSDLDQGRLI
jgi:hypothetical protein